MAVLWDMCIVHKAVPSSDRKLRSVELRNARGEIISRPINKVYPLVRARDLASAQPQVSLEPSPQSDAQTNGQSDGACSGTDTISLTDQDRQEVSTVDRRLPRKAKIVARQKIARLSDDMEDND